MSKYVQNIYHGNVYHIVIAETKLALGQVCTYINYWDSIESEGLGPTESIICKYYYGLSGF